MLCTNNRNNREGGGGGARDLKQGDDDNNSKIDQKIYQVEWILTVKVLIVLLEVIKSPQWK